MTDAQLRLDLIHRGIIKPTDDEVKRTKAHVMRLVDDRLGVLKVKKPGDGRSKSPQFGRR